MKKLFLGMMLLAGLAACDNKSKTATTSASGDAFDSLTIEVDSMAVSMTLKVGGTVSDELLKASLAQFVGEQMFFNEDSEGKILMPAYEGDLQLFLQACARQKWEELKLDTYGPEETEESSETPTPEEQAKGMTDEDGEPMYLSSYAITFCKTYETDEYVTWQAYWDFYVRATPHPSFGASGITLRKADGKPLGHDLLKDTDSDSFGQLLKEATKKWVAEELGMKADTDEDMRRYIWDERDINHLPLPEYAPFLTAEGVVLPYQEGELIFSREPQLILLTYDKVKPYLK